MLMQYTKTTSTFRTKVLRTLTSRRKAFVRNVEVLFAFLGSCITHKGHSLLSSLFNYTDTHRSMVNVKLYRALLRLVYTIKVPVITVLHR